MEDDVVLLLIVVLNDDEVVLVVPPRTPVFVISVVPFTSIPEGNNALAMAARAIGDNS